MTIRSIIIGLLFISGASAATPTTSPAGTRSIDSRFTIGRLIYSDDFAKDSPQWVSELENGGSVKIADGRMDVDVPAGATVWFKTVLQGPILIEYRATAISAGGANDRVSDINCFWMARDSRNAGDLFAIARHGKFAEYNPLLTYYVGLGGNGNTTTRFRRYVGDQVNRPLLPQNDLSDKKAMIVANRIQLIQVVAYGTLIQYYRDGQRLFEMDDSQPYTSGWFGFRTTKSHVQFQDFKIFEVAPAANK